MEVIGRHSGLYPGENKVLDWLEKGLSHIQGQILVEPPFKRKNEKFNKWPDFLIISPSHGVCILECKGYGKEEIKAVDRVRDLELVHGLDKYRRQLAGYGMLLSEILKDQPVSICKVAIFPYILGSDPVAQAISEVNQDEDISLIFAENMEWDCSLEMLFGPPMLKKLRMPEFEEVLHLLNPIRVFEHNFVTDLDIAQRRIKSFDKEQMKYLERIKSEGHYIINGLPGTGKTKMLIALAEREKAKGRSVLYTCFNRPLRDSVVPFLDKDTARTTSSIYFDKAKAEGLAKEENWKKQVIPLLKEDSIEPIYDVLLIDEYQDLNDDDYAILLKYLKPDGLLVLAGDRLQNIMGRNETWKSKGINIKTSGHSMFLSVPYRTEPDIVDYALKFICTNASLKKVAERYFKDHSFEHRYGTFAKLNHRLTLLMTKFETANIEIGRIIEENPDAEILIVTCFEGQRARLPFKTSSKLKIEPYTRVKGLEADIVILYNLDFFKEWRSGMGQEERMKSIFSALCRTRSSVIVHGFSCKDYYQELRDLYLECLSSVKVGA